VTRNDGKTANDAVNELVFHLVVSIVVVIALLLITLGWREASIVALAIPLTLFITLAIGMIAGQTINRITLFALILSLGLLVDDAIVVVENIHRHYKLQQHSRLQGAILAVNEIGMPTILATLTVVLAFIPMAFVTGMMGPYMMPIPFNVPVAMITSLFVAFIVTPWASYRLMKSDNHGEKPRPLEETKIYRIYKKILGPLLDNSGKRKIFMAVVIGVFLITMLFPLVQWVKFRMLPKANKNTFLVSIDMPAGTALETTDRATRAVGDYIGRIPEVKDYETFVGTGSVIDFNGLLRGGAFREASHFADVRVNLTDKEERKRKSEDIVLAIRPDIAKLAEEHGANIKLVEDPPGPPVRATVVAEIYGPDYDRQREIAQDVKALFAKTAEVVDIDDSVKEKQDKYQLLVDKEKAALAGVSTEQIVQTLRMSVAGMAVSTLHVPSAKNPVSIFLRLPKGERAGISDIEKVYVAGPQGNQVPLASLVKAVPSETDKAIHHKNLEPVTYVYGEMGNRSQVYAVIDMMKYLWKHPLPDRHLSFARGAVPLLHDSGRDHGGHPAFDDRHHAGLRPDGRVLQRYFHDRRDRPGRHRGAQFHRASGIHPGQEARGHALEAGPDRGRRHPHPAHRAHGRGGHLRLHGDRGGPRVVRPCPCPGLRDAGLHGPHPRGDPALLLHGRAEALGDGVTADTVTGRRGDGEKKA
jgi:multidrug efflux pump subunit AcrB